MRNAGPAAYRAASWRLLFFWEGYRTARPAFPRERVTPGGRALVSGGYRTPLRGPIMASGQYHGRSALLAQLAEQLTLNQPVVGSNPTQGIEKIGGSRLHADWNRHADV